MTNKFSKLGPAHDDELKKHLDRLKIINEKDELIHIVIYGYICEDGGGCHKEIRNKFSSIDDIDKLEDYHLNAWSNENVYYLAYEDGFRTISSAPRNPPK